MTKCKVCGKPINKNICPVLKIYSVDRIRVRCLPCGTENIIESQRYKAARKKVKKK